MLSRPIRAISLLLVLISLTTNALSVRATTGAAPEDELYDDYEVTARVMRISLLRGEVSLRRSGNRDWESAKLNLPLVEGDTISTGKDSHVEIQIDARNFVRVDAGSVLSIVTLREEGIALSLSEGTASVRLARFDRDKEYFELDAPKTTIAAEKQGLYRLDVQPGGRVRVVVRQGGQARIYSATSGFTLRDKRMAELVFEGAEEGDWELSAVESFDTWDSWVDERERYLATRLRYEERDRYYDRDVWGAEELDAYGDWTYVSSYGWVWRPHVTVINNYRDWAPYRHGHWSWCPPYGWVWVGDEPWGWAPYHYGRWVFHNNSWCWAPRGYGYSYRRAWWRPALVAFVYVPTSYGENVCWYPLGYGHRDPHSRYWQRHPERLTALRRRELSNLHRIDPARLRAVSTVRARDFGAPANIARPATTEIARRAIAGDPVRGRLPITPNDSGRSVQTDAAGRTRLTIARPAPLEPRILERSTGAAARTPGVPLDNDLRRLRVFNNREPRVVSPEGVDSSDRRDTGGTGAVIRPVRPVAQPPDERQGETPAASDSGGSSDSAPSRRQVRPTRPERRDDGEISAPDNSRPAGRERPSGAPSVRNPDRPGGELEIRRPRPADPPEDRPSSPQPNVPDSPQPEHRIRPMPEYRREDPPSRPQNDDAPVARPHRSEPREERTAPPPREERNAPPPAREERSAPPPPREERSAPPPQREERSAPPPPREERSAPPPQQEERSAPPPPREERSAPPPQREERAPDRPSRPSRDEPR